jgi:hypothetical protein
MYFTSNSFLYALINDVVNRNPKAAERFFLSAVPCIVRPQQDSVMPLRAPFLPI